MMPRRKHKFIGTAWKESTSWPPHNEPVGVYLLCHVGTRGEKLEEVVEGEGQRFEKGVRFKDSFGDCTNHVQAWRHFEEEFESPMAELELMAGAA